MIAVCSDMDSGSLLAAVVPREELPSQASSGPSGLSIHQRFQVGTVPRRQGRELQPAGSPLLSHARQLAPDHLSGEMQRELESRVARHVPLPHGFKADLTEEDPAAGYGL